MTDNELEPSEFLIRILAAEKLGYKPRVRDSFERGAYADEAAASELRRMRPRPSEDEPYANPYENPYPSRTTNANERRKRPNVRRKGDMPRMRSN